MDITRIDAADDAEVARYVSFRHAVHEADTPHLPAECSIAMRADLREPPVAADVERRVVRSGDDILGDAAVWMPTNDNLHFAGLEVRVHPDHRRRGIGRTLLDDALGMARSANRRTASSFVRVGLPEGPYQLDRAGAEFAEAMGFVVAYTEVEHRAQVSAEPSANERRLYDEAVAASADDYETVAWAGRVPEELLPGVAEIDSTFLGEAPIGDLDLERENIDADRMRRQDDRHVAMGTFMCGVVARHRESGDTVANTVIGVNTEPGDHAGQWITIVSPQHRGHKLGLRIKLENLNQVRKHRPAVRWIWTGNADVNKHMIAINEQLGFTPVHLGLEYQRTI